jgi:NADPH:quinone reductase-like Zn-dependent oxidoreductase
MMKAVGLYKYLPIDHPESLVDVEVPMPEPAPRDLLEKVKAVSVNPVDTKVRSPKDKIESTPRVLGWDASGIVERVGSAVTLFKPGDEVYYAGSITRPGCNADYHVVDERSVGRKPRNLSFEQAAAMPLTTITAWEALFDRMDVPLAILEPDGTGEISTGVEPEVSSPFRRTSGHSVLIIGGAGGVGSIAIQLAKQLAKMRVIATASRPESADWCRRLGADDIINHHQPFQAEFARIGAEEVDYIFCLNSTEKHIQNMADVIKPQGRVCTIVEAKGPVNINPFQRKSVAFCWELMFTRPMFETPDMQAQHSLLNETAALLESGVLRTTQTRSFGPLNAENLRRAHAAIEKGDTIGKVTLGEP